MRILSSMLLALCGGMPVAHATVPDLFGMGARWSGAGGGGIALVDDGTSAFVNPAGLAWVRRPTAGIGYVIGKPRFEAVPDVYWDTNRDGSTDDLDRPLVWDVAPPPMGGVDLQLSRHLGDRFGIGFTAFVPTSNLLRFATFDPELPNYIMWENRPQRFVAAAGVGGWIVPGLSVGVGANLLAKSKITVAMTVDAVLQGDVDPEIGLEDAIEEITIDVHEIDLSVVPTVGPIAGLQVHLGEWVPVLDGLSLGLSYQGAVAISVDADIDLQANVGIEDVGDLDPYLTAIVLDTGLNLSDHYVPTRVVLGVAYERHDTLTMYLDTRWADWRGMVLNVAQVQDVEVASPLIDLNGTILDGNPHTFEVRPVWSVRTGAEILLPEWTVDGPFRFVRVSVRGGAGFEPSPLVTQGSSSAFLDSGRSLFTVGAGVQTWEPFGLLDGTVRFDVFFQHHVLAAAVLPRSASEPTPGYPVDGGGIPVGGVVDAGGIQWTFEY